MDEEKREDTEIVTERDKLEEEASTSNEIDELARDIVSSVERASEDQNLEGGQAQAAEKQPDMSRPKQMIDRLQEKELPTDVEIRSMQQRLTRLGREAQEMEAANKPKVTRSREEVAAMRERLTRQGQEAMETKPDREIQEARQRLRARKIEETRQQLAERKEQKFEPKAPAEVQRTREQLTAEFKAQQQQREATREPVTASREAVMAKREELRQAGQQAQQESRPFQQVQRAETERPQQTTQSEKKVALEDMSIQEVREHFLAKKQAEAGEVRRGETEQLTAKEGPPSGTAPTQPTHQFVSLQGELTPQELERYTAKELTEQDTQVQTAQMPDRQDSEAQPAQMIERKDSGIQTAQMVPQQQETMVSGRMAETREAMANQPEAIQEVREHFLAKKQAEAGEVRRGETEQLTAKEGPPSGTAPTQPTHQFVSLQGELTPQELERYTAKELIEQDTQTAPAAQMVERRDDGIQPAQMTAQQQETRAPGRTAETREAMASQPEATANRDLRMANERVAMATRPLQGPDRPAGAITRAGSPQQSAALQPGSSRSAVAQQGGTRDAVKDPDRPALPGGGGKLADASFPAPAPRPQAGAPQTGKGGAQLIDMNAPFSSGGQAMNLTGTANLNINGYPVGQMTLDLRSD